MHRRTTLRAAAVALSFGAALTFPSVAMAGSHHPYVGPVAAGGTCTAAQAHDHAWGTHGGHRYECRRVSPGCYLFKRVIDAGEPTGQWTGGPAHCPACQSPTPSASPSQTPSSTPSVTPSATPSPTGTTAETPTPAPTTPAAGAGAGPGELPVTGPNVWSVGLFGALLALFGAAVLYVTRRRRTT